MDQALVKTIMPHLNDAVKAQTALHNSVREIEKVVCKHSGQDEINGIDDLVEHYSVGGADVDEDLTESFLDTLLVNSDDDDEDESEEDSDRPDISNWS